MYLNLAENYMGRGIKVWLSNVFIEKIKKSFTTNSDVLKVVVTGKKSGELVKLNLNLIINYTFETHAIQV